MNNDMRVCGDCIFYWEDNNWCCENDIKVFDIDEACDRYEEDSSWEDIKREGL